MTCSIPMVRREPKHHFSDCCFCLTNTAGHSSTTKHTIKYTDVSSALKPMPHGVGLRVPQPHLETTKSGPSQESETEDAQPSVHYVPDCQNKSAHLINKKELNDLDRDLKLTKQAELLGSRLQQWNLLSQGTKLSRFRARNTCLSLFLHLKNSVCVCVCVCVRARACVCVRLVFSTILASGESLHIHLRPVLY
jgi:hypothetical protein